MWSWSGFACHCKLLEFVRSILSITENCFSCPEFVCLIARCFPIISVNIIAPLIVPVGDAWTTFQCDLFVKESYATWILTSYISPLINRLVQSFAGLNVVSNPCHVCFIMLPPVLCSVLCGCWLLGFKGECEGVCLRRQPNVLEFPMHTAKVAVIWLRITNVHCSLDACPCLFQVSSGSSHLEVIYIHNQKTVELLMMKNWMPNVR